MVKLAGEQPLVVLEMANNHMGSLEHGLRLIEAFGEVCRPFPFRFAMKLQYRQMETFIHPDYQDRVDLKYIKRFMETRLSREEFRQLIQKMKDNGFLTMCTPFDNESVGIIEEDGFDIIKIASCSFSDWPLLERIAQTDMPIIASAAAASSEELDNVVTFLSNRGKDFALNHCVAEYPTPPEKIQLNQIEFFKNRYPGVQIGYSTHEPPDYMGSIAMAVAKGATIFERHVALEGEGFSVNAYSATPQEFELWLQNIEHAFTLCGERVGTRITPSQEEVDSLRALRRGVFLRHDVKAENELTDEDVFFAIPCLDDQITANDWSKYVSYAAKNDLKEGAPLLASSTHIRNSRAIIMEIVRKVSAFLDKGNIVLPEGAELEISHHYGQEKFEDSGVTIITVINRNYCKKVLALLPGQSHPVHFHKKKEESFYVLHGSLDINLDGQEHTLNEGEMITVQRGVPHSFKSDSGVIFEEVSTRHYVDDSYYADPEIMANTNRKTIMRYWHSVVRFD